MRGEIIKIIEKKSIYGNKMIEVHLKLEDGSFGICYLVPEYRNFERWKNFLKVGQWLDGLKIFGEMNGKRVINADSFPRLTEEEKLAKMGVF